MLDISTIVTKFDHVFGDVLTSEQILEKFYAARQKPDEDVSSWGCRLGEILSRCPDPNYRCGGGREAMMRQKFWAGLSKDKVKEATRHRFDQGAAFQELLVACRTVELETEELTKTTQAKKPQANQLMEKSTLDQVLQKLKDLESKVVALEGVGARGRDQAKFARDQQGMVAASPGDAASVPHAGANGRSGPKCWHCGQFGHIRRNCHKKQDLNEEPPTTGGGRDVPLRPLDELVEIRSATGDILPYLGFIESNLSLADLSLDVLLLVVPDTDYNSMVPLLVGTNILCELSETRDKVTDSVWRKALKSYSLSSAEIGSVYTTQSITIGCSSQVSVKGITRCSVGRPLNVLTESSVPLPGGLILVSSLQKLPSIGIRSTKKVSVIVKNVSRHPVTIPAKTTLCSLVEAELNLKVPDVGDFGDTSVSPVEAVVEPKSTGDKASVEPRSMPGIRDSFPTLDSSSKNLTEGLTENEFLSLFKFQEDLDPEHLQSLKSVLWKWRTVFSVNDQDIGHTHLLKHRIELSDEKPFKIRHRRIPPLMYDEVKKHLRQMLETGIIRPSCSPWASPVVLVRKKDGTLRFCLDFRELNKRTIRDAYALPRIEETLDAISGSEWFSCLDLKSGYWQVEVEEDHKERTAFTVGSLGFYECNAMPFGLTNAPSTFQRLMELALQDIHLEFCLVYIDDVIVFSTSVEEHIKRLEAVFQR
jgi:hypothetical protein